MTHDISVDIEDLKKFIDKKVVNIQVHDGLIGEYYTLEFDDGSLLSAIDGEYGDNAFYTTTKKES